MAEEPNLSARGADDVDMGDEAALSGVSDAESIGSDEVREPRRRNSPSDPIKNHVLTRHASFPRARSSRETPRRRPQGA